MKYKKFQTCMVQLTKVPNKARGKPSLYTTVDEKDIKYEEQQTKFKYFLPV